MPSNNQKSISIRGPLYDQFKAFCAKNNLKMGKVTEELIEKFLAENESGKRLPGLGK